MPAYGLAGFDWDGDISVVCWSHNEWTRTWYNMNYAPLALLHRTSGVWLLEYLSIYFSTHQYRVLRKCRVLRHFDFFLFLFPQMLLIFKQLSSAALEPLSLQCKHTSDKMSYMHTTAISVVVGTYCQYGCSTGASLLIKWRSTDGHLSLFSSSKISTTSWQFCVVLLPFFFKRSRRSYRRIMLI